MKKQFCVLLIFSLFLSVPLYSKTNIVYSPNKQIKVTVTTNDKEVNYGVQYKGKSIINNSQLGIVFDGKHDQWSYLNNTTTSVDEKWNSVIGKRSVVSNKYNQLQIELQEKSNHAKKMDITFRVFDDGLAFQYNIDDKANTKVKITNDLSQFVFTDDYTTWSYNNEFPNVGPVNITNCRDTLQIPVTLCRADEVYMAIHEADIDNFGWFDITVDADKKALKCHIEQDSVNLPFLSSWRVIMISDKITSLVDSDILENLNPPCVIDDPSWIKPGKAVWDWYANGYVSNDGFVVGQNYDSWVRMVDFAAQNNIEYLMLDADWYGPEHEASSNPTSTQVKGVKEILKYAKDKNIDVILYLNDVGAKKYGLQDVISTYAQWGAVGIKYGFMNEQNRKKKIEYTRKVIALCAENKLTCNFHDSPIPPSGDSRTYPNCLTREYCHSQADALRSFTPYTFCTQSFVNALAGPLDMCNGMFDLSKEIVERPWVRYEIPSTIVAEAARALITYSGLLSLPDATDSYKRYMDLFDFISSINMPWDNSETLMGQMGEYIVVKRQKGDVIHIAAATNESARELSLPLSFLDNRTYKAVIYEDAPEANFETNREKYIISERTITKNDLLTIKMSRGGGWCLKLTAVK